MTDSVRYTVQGGVARITLNRPEAMNSLDIATKVALLDAVRTAAADADVRCVVLAGTGRAFCVGQDLKEHIELLGGDDAAALSSTVSEHYNPIVTTLLTMPKPVVAAVNGVAAGAGASLALACDLRILSAEAGFNFAFAGVALAGDTGISWTLPRLVGMGRATELLYFPRTIGAAESAELGLATRVVSAEEFEDTVTQLATRLAAGPTVAYGAIRQSLRVSAAAPLEEALAFEQQMMARSGASEDHPAAVAAFVSKQQPVFRGR